MKYFALLFYLFFSLALVSIAQPCRAEPPLVAVSIAAHESTTFGDLLPVIERSRPFGRDIRFATRPDDGIGVTIEVRSDVKLLPRFQLRNPAVTQRNPGEPTVTFMAKDEFDSLRSDLRKLGVREATIKIIEILPSTEFSVNLLRTITQSGRTVLVICKADWSVESQRIEKEILLNREIIAAAKRSSVVAMQIDMTDPLPDDQMSFLDRHGMVSPGFWVFGPQSARPTRIRNALAPQSIVEVLEASAIDAEP